jgi:hypothetical protein
MSNLFALKFRKILNDLKRRPEDAFKELNISNEEINKILENLLRCSVQTPKSSY